MTVTLSTHPFGSRVRSGIAIAAFGVLLAGCAGAPEPTASDIGTPAANFPVEVTSCGHTSTLTAAPSKAVTLNQGATEVMLALGLEEKMAGTAYLDDEVADRWKDAYDSVPVLAKEFPSHEQLIAAQPDFIYASYASAFEAKVAGTQPELDADKVASYLSPFGCEDKTQRPEPTFQAVWDEIAAVADAFGVPERAKALEETQQKTLDAVTNAGKGLKVLWYDSATKTPYVGGGSGSPQVVIDAIGATNVFAKLDAGWADGNWEDVLAADPDVIVLADASWDTAAAKKAYLQGDPVLSQLRAVKDDAFVTVPFSETTAGVRLADGVESVADQIAALKK